MHTFYIELCLSNWGIIYGKKNMKDIWRYINMHFGASNSVGQTERQYLQIQHSFLFFFNYFWNPLRFRGGEWEAG